MSTEDERDIPKFLSYLTGAQYVHPAVTLLVIVQPNKVVPEGLIYYSVYPSKTKSHPDPALKMSAKPA